MTIRLMVVGCLLLCLAVGAVCAEAPESTTGVLAVLAPVHPGAADEIATAEDTLVADGHKLLPAMRELLTCEQRALRDCRRDRVHANEATRHALWIDILDSALIRLNWPVDPQHCITTWMDAFTAPDGKPLRWQGLQCERRASRIVDDHLALLFPDLLFYQVQLSPATPPPAWLHAENILTVNRQGRVQVINTPAAQEVLFHSVVQPSLSTVQSEMIMGWLRLALALRGITPEQTTTCFSTNETTLDGTSYQVVQGKASARLLSACDGELSVKLFFADDTGQLCQVREEGTLHIVPSTH